MPSEIPSYHLLDFGNGKRLEQWGDIRLIRPDPAAIGSTKFPDLWQGANAIFEGEKGRGEWRMITSVPEQWLVRCADVTLTVKLSPYKHTGVFPEQAQNWQWMRGIAAGKARPLSILSLFAYTGGASIALASDGHNVTHVDSSRPAIGWAKENAAINTIAGSIRWILDDAPVFVVKERKRGKRYDAILLDPPAYGHGPTGKAWRAGRDTRPLLEACVLLLSQDPAFLLLNSYAQHDTPADLHRLLTGILHAKLPCVPFTVEAQELPLAASDGRTLSTGCVVRVQLQMG